MRIVRTIGQAFEVCHKLNASPTPASDTKEDQSDRSSEDNERRVTKNNDASSKEQKELNTNNFDMGEKDKHKVNPPKELALKQAQQLFQTVGANMSSPLGSPVVLGENNDSNSNSSNQLPLSQHHQMQLLRQQLEQQQHQTQVAIAQVHLLKDQLSAESAARIEAQARAHQLLLHNKDLLDHVGQLVCRVQTLELKVTGITSVNEPPYQSTQQVPALPDATTPRPAPVYLPEVSGTDRAYLDAEADSATFTNTKAADLDTDSPDSGHKEMSSESLSYNLANGDASGWLNPYGSSPQPTSPKRDSSGWFCSPKRDSPQSSSPSKSSTLKGSGSNPCGNIYNPPSSFASSFQTNTSSKYTAQDVHGPCGVSKPEGSADKTKTTAPVSAQDGKRLEMKPTMSQAPKIDPPPRYHRSSRSMERWERGSWYGAPNMDATASNMAASDSDYFSTYNSSNAGGVVFRPHPNRNVNGGSSMGAFRYSDSSARSSTYSDNRDSMASLSSLRQKLELRVNNLNHAAGPGVGVGVPPGTRCDQGKWRMRISYTSDDNSDNSEDCNNMNPARGGDNKIKDSAVLDEFDSLRS